MNRNALTFFSAATFSTFALLSTSALAAGKIGVVSAADPSVRILGVDGKERQVKLGDGIFADDTVKTDGKGKAQLVFEDRSTVTVNENSELKIDHFIYNPATDTGEMGMKTVKGAFRFIGGALSKQHPVTIQTPVATIGIRGGIVDTHVEANGRTDAVFVYGREMTMTNAAGNRFSTTQYGTGLSLADARAIPAPLPVSAVQASLSEFAHTASAGGGAPVTPTPQSVAPQMKLGTEGRSPEPLAVPAPAAANGPVGGAVNAAALANPVPVTAATSAVNNAPAVQTAVQPNAAQPNAAQPSAPILFVEGNSVSALDIAALSTNLATQQKDGTTQTAATAPEKLRALVDARNLQTQVLANDGLKNFLRDAVSVPVPVSAAATGTTPTLPRSTLPAANLPTVIPTANIPVAATGGAGAGAGSGAGLAENFTAVSGRTGKFLVLSDTNSDGFLDVANQGDVNITQESPDKYRISFTSTLATPLATRNIIVPKLTSAGVTDTTANVVENGVIGSRHVEGYRTQGGAMEAYHLEDTAASLSDSSKEINFVVGSNIFDNSGTFVDAAARSVTAANSGSVHGAATNGVLLYDFLPEVGEGNGNQFGNFNYNRASGINDTDAAPQSQQTEFGTAIDWKTGKAGNLFSGQVNWLPVGGKSSATGAFGKANAAPSAINDYNIAGKRLAYTAEAAGTSTGGSGSLKGDAFAVNGAVFGNVNGPVEGAMVNYLTPTNKTSVASTAQTQLGLTGGAVANRGTQAIALKGNISGDLATQVANPSSVGNHTGFASGVMMVHNGTNYTPTIFSNNVNTDVALTPAAGGVVGGSIAVQDYNTNGSGGGGYNTTTTSFSNPNNSVYINNRLYAAQSGSTTHANSQTFDSGGTTGANAAQAFIVSGGAVNNAKSGLSGGYKCDDCQFVNWGVWSGDVGERVAGSGHDDYAAMIPYVVGQVTQNASLLAPHSANYKGEAYATVVKSGINPQNVAGTMDATVNYVTGLPPQLNNLNLNFGTVQGSDLNLRNNGTAAVAPSGDATYSVPLVSSGTPADIAGKANGALYGAAATEIGGNYTFNRTTDNLNGGGIYFGKQR